MAKFNAEKFLTKLYELAGQKDGAKVIVKSVYPKNTAGLKNLKNNIKTKEKANA